MSLKTRLESFAAAVGADIGRIPSQIASYDPIAGINARLASSRRGPVIVVCAGSSTTEGVGATTEDDRWVNQFAKIVQAAYPSGVSDWEPPVLTLSQALANQPMVPGVHFVNAGVSSTFSNTYLTSTTRDNINAIGAAVVLHMIGSNDHAIGTSPAAFATNLAAQIDGLPNQLHVVLDTFVRPDIQTPAYPWTDYIAQMEAVSKVRPNAVFIGQNAEWVAANASSYDPLDPYRLTRWRLNADIHPSDAGHALLASMAARGLRVPQPKTSIRPQVLDRFSRSTLGSAETGQAWEAQGGAYVPSDGSLKVTTAGNVVVNSGFSDVEVSALVTTSASSVHGLIAKSNDSSTRIGAYWNGPSGRCELYLGASLLAWSSSGWGDVAPLGEHFFRLCVKGRDITFELDGQLVLTHTLTEAQGTTYSAYTRHGVRTNTVDSTVKYRNFSVRKL